MLELEVQGTTVWLESQICCSMERMIELQVKILMLWGKSVLLQIHGNHSSDSVIACFLS
jgi:hypothetical protein